MRSLLWSLLIIFSSSLGGYVYLFTDNGDIFRTSDGVNFELISNTGEDGNVALVFSNDGYMLTRGGVILRTQDNGLSWVRVAGISVSDAVDMIYTGGNFYVLTESGDLYKGSSVTSLTLISSIGASNFVALASGGGYLYALTSSGDVWRSSSGSSWSDVGSTGSMEMVSIDSAGDSLFAIDNSGDIMKSVDSGLSWNWIGTLSQIGVADMMITDDGIYLACFDTGELMKRTESGWQYTGTASQIGIAGMSASGVPTFIGDTSGNMIGDIFKVRPVISSGMIYVESPAGVVEIYNATGQRVLSELKGDGILRLDMRGYPVGVYFVRGFGRSIKVLKY